MQSNILNFLKTKKQELENQGFIPTLELVISELENKLMIELKKDLSGIDEKN